MRWHQAWRETGTFEAKPCGGSRSPFEDYAEEIIALVENQRDRTLDEIVAAMHERRIPGSRTALFRFLERHGITFKKSPTRERAGAYGRGAQQGLLDSSRLIFIDETSVNTNMTRPCGRGRRGERVIGRVPLAAWKTLTFVAALRCDRMTASMMIKGAMNGEAFLAYGRLIASARLVVGELAFAPRT